MVEFEALGPVGGREQQSPLPAAHLAAPFAQPAPHVGDRKHGRVGLLEQQFLQRLGKQLRPGPGPRLGEALFDRAPRGSRSFRFERVEQGLRLSGSPERSEFLAGALERNSAAPRRRSRRDAGRPTSSRSRHSAAIPTRDPTTRDGRVRLPRRPPARAGRPQCEESGPSRAPGHRARPSARRRGRAGACRLCANAALVSYAPARLRCSGSRRR